MRNVLLVLLTCLFAYTASAQCHSSFTYTTSGLTATFTNTSTPSSVSTPYYLVNTINFGTGSGSVYFGTTASKTYATSGTYQVVSYMEIWDSLSNTLVCSDFDTQMVTVTAPPPPPCSISISKVISGNTVVFTANNLANTPGMTYSWNFGDNTTGTGSPVTHVYAAPGSYNVLLTGSSSSASCSQTDSITVHISPNVITGAIFADSLSMDTFKVWLITYDSSTQILEAIDSVIVSNGFTQVPVYTFTAPPGQYRTKAAQLDGPSSGTGFIPTYHANSLYWNTATLINHTGGTTSGRNIYMQTGTVTSGPGFIGGNVTMGANKGTSNGVEGMQIFLRDNAANVIRYTYTDANGDYSFGNLPTGLYSIYPEEVGYTTTSASVILTPAQTSSQAVNFEKSEGKKTVKPKNTGVSDITIADKFSVSPNPSSGMVFINWSSAMKTNANIAVTDIAGRKVYQSSVKTTSRTEMDLSQLQAGLYFISIEANGRSATKQIVIQK